MNGLRTISKSVVLFGLLFPFLASSVSSSSEETTINFSGTVKSGGNYLHVINKDIFFELKATKAGWEMAVRSKDRPKENLARLTPPVNDVDQLAIELKNGEVPQKSREFVFSPKVGEVIQGHLESNPVSEEEVERVRHDGHGILEMTNLQLGKLNSPHPSIDEMSFDVRISFRPN